MHVVTASWLYGACKWELIAILAELHYVVVVLVTAMGLRLEISRVNLNGFDRAICIFVRVWLLCRRVLSGSAQQVVVLSQVVRTFPFSG